MYSFLDQMQKKYYIEIYKNNLEGDRKKVD